MGHAIYRKALLRLLEWFQIMHTLCSCSVLSKTKPWVHVLRKIHYGFLPFIHFPTPLILFRVGSAATYRRWSFVRASVWFCNLLISFLPVLLVMTKYTWCKCIQRRSPAVKGYTDSEEAQPQPPGHHHCKKGMGGRRVFLFCILTAAWLRCWDSRWLALLFQSFNEPKQDRLNCLITERGQQGVGRLPHSSMSTVQLRGWGQMRNQHVFCSYVWKNLCSMAGNHVFSCIS